LYIDIIATLVGSFSTMGAISGAILVMDASSLPPGQPVRTDFLFH
jgi:hypothetical protein